jgi:hypothetical protein
MKNVCIYVYVHVHVVRGEEDILHGPEGVLWWERLRVKDVKGSTFEGAVAVCVCVYVW